MFKLNKKEFAWTLYDVGVSAFYTTILAGFFPVFFKQYWNTGVDPTVSTYNLGLATTIASVIVAMLCPFFGTMAQTKKTALTLLLIFSLMGIISCMLLSFLYQGQYKPAMFLFITASCGGALAVMVYDFLLVKVTEKSRYHLVSLSGFGLGYLGGGLLFLVNVLMTLKPQWFFLSGKVQAVKVSMFLVGIWWLLFLIPISIILLKSSHQHKNPNLNVLNKGFFLKNKALLIELFQLFKKIKNHKPVVIFLCAYFFYIDGVGTIMKMSVDYGMSLGFPSSSLMIALLIVQFIGFPASYIFILIAKHFGAKNGIIIAISIYIIINISAYFMNSVRDFYLLAIGVALAQGGLQALSRSYYASLIPEKNQGQLFGLYHIFNKFASIIGPFMLGLVALISGSNRLSILSVLLLFIVGLVILYFVPSDYPTDKSTEIKRYHKKFNNKL